MNEEDWGTLKIDKVTVIAKERTLKDGWTIAPIKEIEIWHDPETLEELAQILAEEMTTYWGA